MAIAIQRFGPGLTTGHVGNRYRPTLPPPLAPARVLVNLRRLWPRESCDQASQDGAVVRLASPRRQGRRGESAVVGHADPAGVPPQRLPGAGTGTCLR